MPTYEYACTSCGQHLEVSQSFSDPPLTECPNCNGQLRKVFGSIGIVLKGSGFYRNDNRTSSNGKNGRHGENKPSEPAGTAAATDPAPSTSAGSSSPQGGTSKADGAKGDTTKKSAASS